MKLADLPNGTIIRYRKRLYCLQYGLEGRIAVDVNFGSWNFIEELNWKTFTVEYKP